MTNAKAIRSRTMAVLVVACMMLCVLSPAIIDWNEEGFFSEEGERPQFTYVALGDSMVNGFGLTDYYPDGETYKGQLSGGDIVLDDPSTYNYYGLSQTPADAFPTLMKNYLEDTYGFDVNEDYMLAMSGMRSAELRSMFYDGFKDDTYTTPDKRLGHLFQIESFVEKTGIDSEEDLKAYYRDMVAVADLITYNFHYDFPYTLSGVLMSLVMPGSVELNYDLYLNEAQMETFEMVEEYFWDIVYLVLENAGIDPSTLPLDMAAELVSAMAYVVMSYCLNFDANMKYIFENNKNGYDANVIVIDSYNFFADVNVWIGDIMVPLGDIFGYLVEMCNIYTTYLSPYSSFTCHATIDSPPTTYATEFENYESLDKVTNDALAASIYTTIAWGGGEQPNDLGMGYANMGNFYYGGPGGDNLAKFLSWMYNSKDIDISVIGHEDFDLYALITAAITSSVAILNGAPVVFDEETGGCTIYGQEVITLLGAEIAFMRVPFYALFGEAMMAHPSEIGHKELFDQILESTDYLGDFEFSYYASEPVDLQNIIPNKGIDLRLEELADVIETLDPDADKEVWDKIFNSNVIYVKANSGNLTHILSELIAYIDGDVEKDYFQYSAIIADGYFALEDCIIGSIEDFITEFEEGHPDDVNKLISYVMDYISGAFDVFIQEHPEKFMMLYDAIVAELTPLIEKLEAALEYDPEGDLEAWADEAFVAIVSAIVDFAEENPEILISPVFMLAEALMPGIEDFIMKHQIGLSELKDDLFNALDPVIDKLYTETPIETIEDVQIWVFTIIGAAAPVLEECYKKNVDKIELYIEEFINDVLPGLEEIATQYPEEFAEFMDAVVGGIMDIYNDAIEACPFDSIEEFDLWLQDVYDEVSLFIETVIQDHGAFFIGCIMMGYEELAPYYEWFVENHDEIILGFIEPIIDEIIEFYNWILDVIPGYLDALDALIFTVVTVLETEISMIEGMIDVADAIQEINPLATVFYVGNYNALDNVTLDYEDIKVDLGMFGGAFTLVSNMFIKEVCEATDGIMYVDVSDYGATFAPTDITSIDLEELRARLTISDEYVLNAVYDVLDRLVEVPVYSTTWVNGGVPLYGLTNQVAPSASDAYVGNVPTKASDADYDYVFEKWEKSKDSTAVDIVYEAVFTSIYNKKVIDVEDGKTEVTFDVADIGDKKYAEIKSENITAYIPKEVFGDATSATLSMKFVEPFDVPGAYHDLLKEGVVISLELFLDGKKVSDFDGTSVSISVDYELAEGRDPSNIHAFYLNEKTLELEEVECSYQDGKLTITMDHFSYWVIEYMVPAVDAEEIFPVEVAIILVVILGLCAALLRLKK